MIESLQNEKVWKECVILISNGEVIDLYELEEKLEKAFLHDIWQSVKNPFFQTDPFQGAAFTLYLIISAFNEFKKHGTSTKYGKKLFSITLVDIDYFISLLNSAYHLSQKGGLSKERLYEILDLNLSYIYNRLVNNAFEIEFKSIFKSIIHIIHGAPAQRQIDYGISKMAFSSLGSLLELYLKTILDENKTNLGPLIISFKKKFPDLTKFVPLMHFFRIVRNKIHPGSFSNESILYSKVNSSTIIIFLLMIMLLIRDLDELINPEQTQTA